MEGCSSKLSYGCFLVTFGSVLEDHRQRGTTDSCHQEGVVLMLHSGSEEEKVLRSNVPAPEEFCNQLCA